MEYVYLCVQRKNDFNTMGPFMFLCIVGLYLLCLHGQALIYSFHLFNIFSFSITSVLFLDFLLFIKEHVFYPVSVILSCLRSLFCNLFNSAQFSFSHSSFACLYLFLSLSLYFVPFLLSQHLVCFL